MLGNNKSADAYEHDQGREGNGAFVRSQHLAAVGAFVEAALGHKDGVVVALAEDERCQYNINYIKLYVQQPHDAQNPYPADGHRHEGQ